MVHWGVFGVRGLLALLVLGVVVWLVVGWLASDGGYSDRTRRKLETAELVAAIAVATSLVIMIVASAVAAEDKGTQGVLREALGPLAFVAPFLSSASSAV